MDYQAPVDNGADTVVYLFANGSNSTLLGMDAELVRRYRLSAGFAEPIPRDDRNHS